MKKLTILILSLFILDGCYYVDVDDYNVSVESEYNPDVIITSNLDAVDTVLTYDTLAFSYNILIDTGRLLYADVILGSTTIYRSANLSEELFILPEYVINPGLHLLKLRSYCKSYTGSLADQYNAEYIITDSTWIINYELDFSE